MSEKTIYEENPLSLDNIANGSAKELFQEELDKLLSNVADVNTAAKTPRKITLVFTFEPSTSRNEAAVTVEASSKLAPMAGMSGTVWMGNWRGKPVAAPYMPNAQQLLLDAEAKPRLVADGAPNTNASVAQ